MQALGIAERQAIADASDVELGATLLTCILTGEQPAYAYIIQHHWHQVPADTQQVVIENSVDFPDVREMVVQKLN